MDEPALIAPWSGPHGGVPPFARVEVADFKPAVLAAMDQLRAELRAIASAAAPPTFDNTIAAYEDAGRAYTRVLTIYGTYTATMSDDERRGDASARAGPRAHARRLQ
ncbi:MAG: hypothetical protein M3680_31065 [Myxococcota bacterium]|nr:hypothetical protein [Myxococcota bacterium]